MSGSPRAAVPTFALAFALLLPACSATLEVVPADVAEWVGTDRESSAGSTDGGPPSTSTEAIFEADVSGASQGELPLEMEMVRGSWDFVTVDGDTYLGATAASSGFRLRLPEPLPEHFLVEAEVHYTGWSGGRLQSGIGFGEAGGSWNFQGHWVGFNRSYIDLRDEEGDPVVTHEEVLLGEDLIPLAVEVDGSTLRVYQDGVVVGAIQGARVDRSGVIEFRLSGTGEEPGYIGNIRVVQIP